MASHSGGSKPTPNAIDKTTHLIRALSTAELPDGTSPEFPLTGKLTVTAIRGGQGYSLTPDLCTLNVDIRTIPTFDNETAARLLEQLVAKSMAPGRAPDPPSSRSKPTGLPTPSRQHSTLCTTPPAPSSKQTEGAGVEACDTSPPSARRHEADIAMIFLTEATMLGCSERSWELWPAIMVGCTTFSGVPAVLSATRPYLRSDQSCRSTSVAQYQPSALR